MLDTLPVRNCFYFLAPTTLEHWQAQAVPGIVGVLKREASGQYTVLDAFPAGVIPDARDLMRDSRFGMWLNAAGSLEALRFDVFLMPKSEPSKQRDVLTLLERSCGFVATQQVAYAHAV